MKSVKARSQNSKTKKHILFKNSYISLLYSFFRLKHLDCRYKNVDYFISCKTFQKQYTENSKEFRAKPNNCRCANRNHQKNMKVKQESFHSRLADNVDIGEGAWEA